MQRQLKNIFVWFLALCILATTAYPAIPAPEDETIKGDGQKLIRVRRFTCDVLSISVKGIQLNDAACALHCLSMRKSGGHCKNGTCYCRK